MNSRTMSRFSHHEETERPSRFRNGHTAPSFSRSSWEENPDREDRSETGLTRIHSTSPPISEGEESDESDESFEFPDFVPKPDDWPSEAWPRTSPTREDSPELPDPPEYRTCVTNNVSFYHSVGKKGSIPCVSDISAGLDGWLLSLDCSPVNMAHSLGNFKSWASKYHLGHKPTSGASSYAMVMQALRELYQDSDIPVDIWFRMPNSLQRRWIFAVGMSKIAAEEGLTEWKLDDQCLLKKYAEIQDQRLHHPRAVMSPPFIRARRAHCHYTYCTNEGSDPEDEDIEECADIAFYDQGSSSDEMENDDCLLFEGEEVDEDIIPESDSSDEEEDEVVQYLFQYDNGTV